MVARVTLAEVDSVRTSVQRAVDMFEVSVVPELRRQPGYEGCYVLTTPDGKAMVLTFWADDESAAATIASGHYGAQVEKFLAVLRSPSGRDTYEVALADTPAPALG